MRLIDADRLKRSFKNTNEAMFSLKRVRQIINRAPTAEPFEPDYVGRERLKARQEGYNQGYQFGFGIGKTLNPKIKQGKWQRGTNTCSHYLFCSNCKHAREIEYFDYEIVYPKFCEDCGAEMQKGDEK